MNKFLFILLLLSSNLFAQTDTIAYLHAFGGMNNDVAEEIEATIDGGYIVIGSTSSNSWGNTDAYLLKVDSNCNYVWSKALGGANNDWGYSVKQTFDKGYIIALSTNSYGNGGYDACLMKRDSMGNYEWTKTYGGNDWDFAYSVVQTHDSGYVFCGETYNNTLGFSDVYIVKTNQMGDTVWTKTIGGSLEDKGVSVIETSDSNIVVAGVRNTVSDSTQMYVLKLNSSGVLLWDSLYGGSRYESVNEIIEHTNGNYMMVGASTNGSVGGDQDYIVKGISPNGNSLWIFELVNGPSPSPADEEAFAIHELSNSNVLIGGYSMTGSSGKKNIAFFQLTTGGFWGGASGVYGNVEDDYIVSMAVKNNHIVAAGNTNSFGNGMQDFLLMELDTIYGGQDTATSTFSDAIPLKVETIFTSNEELTLYPNPTSGFVNIKPNKSIRELEFFDITGRVVLKKTNDNLQLIDISNFQEGYYLLKIIFNDNTEYKVKILKN